MVKVRVRVEMMLIAVSSWGEGNGGDIGDEGRGGLSERAL